MKAGQDLKNQAAHSHQEFPGAPSRKNLPSARLHSSENAEGKVVLGLFSDEENQKVRESEGLDLQHFYSWRFRFWQQYCWTYTENVPNDATLRVFFFHKIFTGEVYKLIITQKTYIKQSNLVLASLIIIKHWPGLISVMMSLFLAKGTTGISQSWYCRSYD